MNSFQIFSENAQKIYIPRFYGLQSLPYKPTFELRRGEPIDLKFSGQLRKNQIPVVKAIIDGFKNIPSGGGGGIICIPCGFGKTAISLYMISVLKVKTLVIVHQDFLITQWKERIEEFLPGARVGLIQADKFDVENKDIVFGMIQSISMKTYPPEIWLDYGLLIADECHHLGAAVFSQTLRKVATKYMLGLSATPKRTDGLSKVFEWHLGPILYQTKRVTDYLVKVKRIFFKDPNLHEKRNQMGKVFTPNMITDIVKHAGRTKMIVEELVKLAQDGRNILILSERRPHLSAIRKMFDSLNVMITKKNIDTGEMETRLATTGFYVGGMKQSALKDSEKADVILGTIQMAKEGLDIKKLDTLVLATSKPEITQITGRILRKINMDQMINIH